MPCKDYEADYEANELREQVRLLRDRNDELAAKLCTTRKVISSLYHDLVRANEWGFVQKLEAELKDGDFIISELEEERLVHEVHDTLQVCRDTKAAFDEHHTKMLKITSLGGEVPAAMVNELVLLRKKVGEAASNHMTAKKLLEKSKEK